MDGKENQSSKDGQLTEAPPEPANGWLLMACCLLAGLLCVRTLTDRGAPAAAIPFRKPPEFQIDLNLAGIEELQALPDVGVLLAQRICDYRDAHGEFDNIEQLSEIRGFGPTTLRRLKPMLTVSQTIEMAASPTDHMESE